MSYKTKEKAEKACNEITAKLPPGMFRAEIWENLGWHWKLVLLTEGLHVHLYYDNYGKDFRAMVSHSVPGADDGEIDYERVSRYSTDPIALAKRVLLAHKEHRQEQLKAIEDALAVLEQEK